MNDHLLVEALRAREPGATAAVYDAHAHQLYAYCWFQLRCRDTAQVALRDTFIVAEAHIDRLRDPDRFRAWLYAIARLECIRRMPPRATGPDVQVARHDQEDVDQRVTAWHAVQALRPASSELLELAIRRRLSMPDLAAVLGSPLKETQDALDLAHKELEEALAAELLAKQGPYGCTERALLLRARSGGFVHDLSRRLTEHAEACSACGAFRPRSVSARKVYGLLPDPRPVSELRVRIMSCFLDPELVGYRLFVSTRVTEFTPDGFPVQPVRPGREVRPDGGSWFGRRRKGPPAAQEPGVGAQVLRAAIVLTVVGILSGGGVASMFGLLGTDRTPAGTAAEPHPTALPGISQVPESEGSSATRPERPEVLDAAPVSATFPLGARASSAPPTALPMASPVPASGGEGSEPAVATGVLTVSPLFLDLAGSSDGSVELRAEGGPVTWEAKAQGAVRVQPSSGRLQAGQVVTVRIHVSRRPDEHGEGTITFQPGATRVCVTWRKDAPPSTGPSPTPTGSAPATTPPGTPPGTQRPSTQPTPPETQRPGSSRPTPPPSTPVPASPPENTSEPTPSPEERASESPSPSVSPMSAV